MTNEKCSKSPKISSEQKNTVRHDRQPHSQVKFRQNGACPSKNASMCNYARNNWMRCHKEAAPYFVRVFVYNGDKQTASPAENINVMCQNNLIVTFVIVR